MGRPRFRHPRFRLGRLLGAGGSGRVHVARDLLRGGALVALKLLRPGSDDGRWRAEFATLRRVRHPALARAHAAGRNAVDGAPFLAMELVQGEDLGACARSIERAHLERLLLEVAQALACLHRHALLHLDVKPGNILVERSRKGSSDDADGGLGAVADPPRAKLIDLGLVRDTRVDGGPVRSGTAPFVAPEIFRGEPPGPTCDVYAFGVTAYRVLAGRLPWDVGDTNDWATTHLRARPAPLDGASPAVERVLRRCLSKRPELRYPHGEALARAFAAAIRAPSAGWEFHEPTWIGREVELAACDRWREAPRREPMLALVGAPGVGKSRLLEEVATRLESMDRPTLALGARELPASLAAETLRGLDTLASRTGRPSAATRAAEKELSSYPGETSLRLAASRCAALLRETGAFLLIDDVDRLDADGARFLRWLSSAQLGRHVDPPEPSSGGLIVSANSETELQRCLPRGVGARLVELGPLSLADCRRLAEEVRAVVATGRGAHGAEEIARLREKTEGNAVLLIRELTAAVGPGTADGEEHDASGEPASRRMAYQARRLPRTARELLLLIVARGGDLSAELASAALDVDPGVVARALDVLQRHGLAAARGPLARTLHPLVTRAVRRTASAAEWADAHRRLAHALETREGCRLRCAHHLLEAGRPRQAIDVALASLEAPEPTQADLDFRAECLERLADHGETRPLERRRLLDAAGDVYEARGRFAECARVREAVDRRGDLRSRRKLGSALHRSGDVERARKVLESCRRSLRGRGAPEESLRVAAELALLAHFGHRPERARALAEEGLALWRSLAPRARRELHEPALHLHGILGQIAIRTNEPTKAIELLEAGEVLSRASPAAPGLSLLLNNLGLAYHHEGRAEDALAALDRAREVAELHEDGSALVSIECNRAQTLARRGLFESASDAISRAETQLAAEQSARLALGVRYTRAVVASVEGQASPELWRTVLDAIRASGDRFLTAYGRFRLAECSIEAGELVGASRVLDEEPTPAPLVAPFSALRARIAALEGFANRALALVRAHDSAVDSTPAPLGEESALSCAAAEALAGETHAARERLRSLAEIADRRDARVTRCACGLLLAETLLTLGRIREARREIVRVRRLDFQGRDPRERDARASLLEAKALIVDDARAERSAIDDLLAHVAGDAGATTRPWLALDLAMTRSATATACGELETGRRLGLAAEIELRAMRTGAPPRRSPRAASWRARGLGTRQPCRGPGGWRAEHAAALARLAAALSAAGGRLDTATAREAGRALSKATGAARSRARVAGQRTLERALSSASPGKRSAATRGATLSCPIRVHGELLGELALEWPEEREPRLIDGRLLRAFADLLGLVLGGRARVGAESGAEGEPRGGTHEGASPSPTARPTRPLERAAQRTAPLPPSTWRDDWIAEDPVSRRLIERVEKLARADLPILVHGESGVGKDHLVRLLHRAGPRASFPLVFQSCSALPADLLEAELLGFRRGAFSGADETRTGFVFRARGGTFCLEDIGDASPAAQAALSRLVAGRPVRPIGATAELILDVRFVATTSRNLADMARCGDFREDLWYLLRAGALHLPPLRERPGDIGPLALHHAARIPEGPVHLEPAAVEALREHSWPGNVRELIATLRRLAVERGPRIDAVAVRAAIRPAREDEAFPDSLFATTESIEALRARLEEAHLRYLFRTLDGDLDSIAERLGTSTRGVYRRFERFGLRPRDLRGLDGERRPTDER